MKVNSDNAPAFNSTLLTASIVLAQVDVHGLMDYALKAGVGGAIWLLYKIIADALDRYKKAKQTTQQEHG